MGELSDICSDGSAVWTDESPGSEQLSFGNPPKVLAAV
ncbi:hypothetical protein PC129_g4113 [Phytophthora cactorum]|uniref:Uncharacterized protein n=1 Tax=Phytophthora cactorum TaxID=29920 RepID=A0A8T1IKZ6_9STRA|nr:hypothetical protein Pcac1_g13685 [Phytophthora cactorum]KAG2834509.1 hypothetical protein PC112_g6063 [Phytophthora cactorum]KAG2919465.1 hypothetical protein PC114_g6453 [Phytophthora cactorum]KAG2933808.1 hypothetical protein PC115_g5354 [Phytophthora cactorum]KAG2948510.1 hypothetical protein PC117_g5956 [Phytophthora cactorum]